MKKKDTVLIDINNDKNINLLNSNYIKINYGDLVYNNSCKEIDLNFNKVFNKKKIKFLNFIKNILLEMKKYNFNLNIIETEIFNLRHDKSNYIERIIILEHLNESILPKQLIKKVYTDDIHFSNLIKTNYPKIEIELVDNKAPRVYIHPLLSLTNYFIKIFIIVSFFKINNKKKDIKQNTYNIILYPHFFKNYKCSLYKNSFLNLNILIGDETQSNFNLKELIIKQKEINDSKNIFPIEKKITYLNLLKIFINNLKEYFKLRSFIKNDILYGNLNISWLLKKQFVLSFLNRLKLNYYNDAIKEIIDNKTKNINYYMFEYSFGFYVSNILRSISKKIFTIGYQHGIFTKNLMWMDVIEKKNQFNYLPNLIISNQKISIEGYSKFLSKNKIKYKKKTSPEVFKFRKLSSYNSKNILIILGLHDFKDNIKSSIKLSKKKEFENCKFFLKFHPKLKIRNLEKLPDNFKIIKKISKKKKFQIFISQSSSLLYKLIEANIYCKKLEYRNKINIL